MQVKVYDPITNPLIKLSYKPLSDLFGDSSTQLREANLERANLTGCYGDTLTDVTGINLKHAILGDTVLLLAYTLNNKGEKVFGEKGLAHLLPKEHSAITTIAEANEYLTDVLEKKENEKDWQPLKELSTHLQWVVRSALYTILHIPTHTTAMESSEQRERFEGLVAKLIEHFPEVRKATEDFQEVIHPPQGSLPLDEYIIEKYKDNESEKHQNNIDNTIKEITKLCSDLQKNNRLLKEKKQEPGLSSPQGKTPETIVCEMVDTFKELDLAVHTLIKNKKTLDDYYAPPVPTVGTPLPYTLQETIRKCTNHAELCKDTLDALPEGSLLKKYIQVQLSSSQEKGHSVVS